MDFSKILKTFFRVGKKIKEASGDSKLIEKLIFDLRSEQTPGRFFHKLSIRIADYNQKYPYLNINIPSELLSHQFKGDIFYYVKSAILTGLLNSISSSSE